MVDRVHVARAGRCRPARRRAPAGWRGCPRSARSASCSTHSAAHSTAHHGGGRGARARGTRRSRGRPPAPASRSIVRESEGREVAVRGRREEIERVDAARFRVGNRARHERAAEPCDRHASVDGDRAEQRIVAAHLQAGHTDDVGTRLRDDERRAAPRARRRAEAADASAAARRRRDRPACGTQLSAAAICVSESWPYRSRSLT